jgi:hypothetical protein
MDLEEPSEQGAGRGWMRFLALGLVWGMAIGAAGAALVTKWLNFPLSNQLRGMDFAMGTYVPGVQHGRVVSFGVIAAGLLIAGAAMWTMRWWRGLGWTGALLLWLAVLAPMKATMLDAGLLQTLAVEAAQQQFAGAFAQQALPVNFGSEPTVASRLDLNTIEDRLVAGWYFVHGGWWAVFIAGLLAVGIAAGKGSGDIAGWSGGGMAAVFVICCAGPALAEQDLMRAHVAEVRGDLDGAERAYREAMRVDGWQRINIYNYMALGCLDEARGRRDTAEYHVYHAQLGSTQVDPMAALGELARVRTDDVALLSVMRRREAELYTVDARQFHAQQAYGAAVAAEENALERDPASLLAVFYLSRDYYLIGKYSDAASLSLKLAGEVVDPTYRANLYSNAGDALTKVGSYEAAKVAYRKSYLYDYVLNLRGLAALNGPGEDLQ